MHSASLLRLFASLCLLVLLALPGGCAKSSGPVHAPGDAMGTQADYGYDGYTASAPSTAPAPAEAGAYDRSLADEAPAYEAEESAVASARAPRHDPGLGTSYGEQHFSQVTTAPFVRDTNRPDVLLSLWYNDQEGILQAQDSRRAFDLPSQLATADGVFVVSVVDEYGYTMSASQVGLERYVVGQPGQRYKLQVQNNSPHRYEVVASVDGLDVIDGEPASFAKRGYIIDPWSTITVDGWRTSDQSVAAFRFSAMEESYAERKGKGRNIGVLGFAFFHERGGPSWEELQRRNSADPFPSRFSQPPPPARPHR